MDIYFIIPDSSNFDRHLLILIRRYMLRRSVVIHALYIITLELKLSIIVTGFLLVHGRDPFE